MKKKIKKNEKKIKSKKIEAEEKELAQKQNEDYEFWIKTFNLLIKDEKAKLTELLDASLSDPTPRTLNPEVLVDKKVISLFNSDLSRAIGIETGKLTTDIFILSVYFFQVFEHIVKNGFMFNGDKYIFLTASAGQIRVKKAQCIKESTFLKIRDKISCGLRIEDINERGGIIPNKYLAYTALAGSATEPWIGFDIDKAIVVDDFETNVEATVDFVDSADYSIARKTMPVPIPHSDGFGIMLDKPTRMARAPYIKGLLVYFPFDKFIQERCNGHCVVTDIYGVEHDVLGEGIRYILTKSQFKMH